MFGTGADAALARFSEIEQHGGSEIEGNLFVEARKNKLRFIESRKRELRFLKMILWCFELWNFAEGKQRFVLIDVNDLWEGLLNDLWGGSLLWANLLSDEVDALESKIQNSRLLLEQYCTGDLSNCSIWKQLDTSEILKFLDLIVQNLKSLLILKADEIAPCFNQFEILQEKLMLLNRFLRFAVAGCQDEKQRKDLEIGVHTFANRAACLVFLCWVTEGDQRVKLNRMLSDILEDFIDPPCSPDKCAFLLRDPMVVKLQQSKDIFLLRRTVAHFIDVLRYLPSGCTDRREIRLEALEFLETFMGDPPVQDAQFTLISSQIDVFLNNGFLLMLLEDPPNFRYRILKKETPPTYLSCFWTYDKGKRIVHDYVAEVDIIKGKITQLCLQIHSPHSDTDQTSSSSEGSKQLIFSDVVSDGLIRTCAKFILKCLDCISQSIRANPSHSSLWWMTISVRTCVDPDLDALSHMEPQQSSKIEGLTRELRFLKMILLCFEASDRSAAKLKEKQTSMLPILEDIWKREISRTFEDLESKTKQYKLLVKEYCGPDLLHCSLKCGSMTTGEMLVFLDLILQNLKHLEYRACDLGPLLKQMKILQHKVKILLIFFHLAIHGCMDESWQVEAFLVDAHTFADAAARLIFLCWVKEADEASTTELSIMLSNMLQGFIKPSIPNVRALCFGVHKARKCRGLHDTLLLGQTVANFIDLLLENQVTPSTDLWQIIRDGLIFLFSFMADPPKGCVHDRQLKLILSQIDVLLGEDSLLILLLTPDPDKENIILCEKKIDVIKRKIRQLYIESPVLSLYNFPRTNGVGSFDFLLHKLERLKEKLINDVTFIPFAKNLVIKIAKELVSLRPFFNGVFFRLKKDQEKFEDPWLQVIDLAYRTEYVINACLDLLHPIWYIMAYLYNILEKIEAVRGKLDKVETSNIYDCREVPGPYSLESVSRPSERTSYRKTVGEVIGFDQEAQDITDGLLYGSKSLVILSIIGMGGLGKTTLALKVYNSESVKQQFHAFAFCSVSQVHNAEKLLRDILKDINGSNDNFRSMERDDLAHQLWKSLSGKRYIIVIDDIWDAAAWDDVKGAFPNEECGSRVLFTTRDHKVASQVKSTPHALRLRSEDESIELLQRKTFVKDGFSPDFVEVGKRIAENCKGLPLAIAVVAGLLAKDTGNLTWWKEIAGKTSHFTEEGCREIIGLSYNHLSENLKACFLYLSISKEDEVIKAKTLELLWIAEGFISKPRPKSFRSAAKEYMNHLVDLNLVTAVERTARGNIRIFRLHDLVRDFCRQQAREDNFMWLTDGKETCTSSDSMVCNRYRVCCETDESFSKENIIGPSKGTGIHSLLHLGLHAFFWDEKEIRRVIRNLKHIQVLHLKNEAGKIFSDVISRGDLHLLHIRYLNVLDSYAIPLAFREYICNIWSLETIVCLAYEWDNVRYDPLRLKNIWKMKNLRHLELELCEVDVGDDDMEQVHHGLDKMESFSTLVLYDHTSGRKVLERLPNIQKLKLRLKFPELTHQVFPMDFLAKLESLDLDIEKGIRHVRFPSILKRLRLCLPPKYLQILSEIGELPDLQVLRLIGNNRTRWVVEGNKFQKLKYLELRHFRQWEVLDDSFPCLEQLDLCYSHDLEEIPPLIGELATLQRIRIHDCSDPLMNSAIRIKEEQMDYGTTIDLKIYQLRSFLSRIKQVIQLLLSPKFRASQGKLPALRKCGMGDCSGA